MEPASTTGRKQLFDNNLLIGYGSPRKSIKSVFQEHLEGKVVLKELSEYAHFMALSHPFTASQVAQMFLDNIYKLYGLPENIVLDKNKVFFDGQTEVVNRCLECYLSPNQECGTLPPCDNIEVFMVEPITLLDGRMARKSNGVEFYVLMRWANGSVEDAIWESVAELQTRFPSFNCAT
ncbi:hypothetical protein Tco_0217720 [Tanacetum coccineum]